MAEKTFYMATLGMFLLLGYGGLASYVATQWVWPTKKHRRPDSRRDSESGPGVSPAPHPPATPWQAGDDAEIDGSYALAMRAISG